VSAKAARHELAEKPFLGTPRPLPRVLTCHVPGAHRGRWCGRLWTANTMTEYDEHVRARHVHQTLCASLNQSLA
jgi:hypothetical protein